MTKISKYTLAFGLPVALSIIIVSAQDPRTSGQAVPPLDTEVGRLSTGWSLLAQGRTKEAEAAATAVLARSPRSGIALGLALEAAATSDGASGALDAYERWLKQRRLEEPFALRRVASAVLREMTVPGTTPAHRAAALDALRRDGDPSAAQELDALRKDDIPSVTRTLAALGDASAVGTLVVQMKAAPGRNVLVLDALGASGSRQAVDAVSTALTDERSEIRAAAADALGALGAVEQVERLKALLSDRNAYVRIKAAGALLRMKNTSGVPTLKEFAAHTSPGVRLSAAEALAYQRDGAWIALVNELTAVPDPEVQIRAARLLASLDPERALGVLETFQAHDNQALRELAAMTAGEIVTDDLPTLRRLLRSRYPLTRVRASDRVLTLTR